MDGQVVARPIEDGGQGTLLAGLGESSSDEKSLVLGMRGRCTRGTCSACSGHQCAPQCWATQNWGNVLRVSDLPFLGARDSSKGGTLFSVTERHRLAVRFVRACASGRNPEATSFSVMRVFRPHREGCLRLCLAGQRRRFSLALRWSGKHKAPASRDLEACYS